MKRYIKSSAVTDIDDNKNYVKGDGDFEQMESQLRDLVSNIVYEEYDNSDGKYAEIDFEDLLDSVITHIEAIVFEMDDDNEYTELAEALKISTLKNKIYRKITKFTKEYAAEYPWIIL